MIFELFVFLLFILLIELWFARQIMALRGRGFRGYRREEQFLQRGIIFIVLSYIVWRNA